MTIFVNDSFLKRITLPNMMTQAWNIDFHIHIKNVLVERTRPFYKVEYRIGNFNTAATEQSSSVTKENTGNIV